MCHATPREKHSGGISNGTYVTLPVIFGFTRCNSAVAHAHGVVAGFLARSAELHRSFPFAPLRGTCRNVAGGGEEGAAQRHVVMLSAE